MLAVRQTAGIGRGRRAWVSLPGNLHLSLVLRPGVAARRAGELGFVAALATHDVVAASLGDGAAVRLKWPNDVLVNGRKIAGLLLESSLAGAALEWVVLGLGLNLCDHPAETTFPATDLAAEGGSTTPDEAADRFLRHFAGRYGAWRDSGFGPVAAAWREAAAGFGREAEIRLAGESFRARLDGIDDEGRLLATLGDGTVRRIDAGDVFPVAAAPVGVR